MAEEIIRRLNWVDAIIIVILIRIIFVGLRKGIVVEAFKLVGTLCAIFVSLHYYSKLSNYINSHSPIPTDFADFFCIIILAVSVLIVFRFFREGILALMSVHPHEILDKWGSLALSLMRGVFISSLVILSIFLSTVGYFKESVNSSFSKPYLLEVAPRTYAFIFEGIISKFSSDEELNSKIFKSLD